MALPVLDLAQMRAWEQATWAAGIQEQDVIGQAGKSVANILRGFTQCGDRVLVVAGKGHNGDDAQRAAEQLTDRAVDCWRIADPAMDAAELGRRLQPRPQWIVDGLFGIGLNRPLAPEWVQLIEQINQTGIPILSVDVPSGLQAETGQPQGAAIRAAVTVTLGAPKKGLLAADAWPYVGRLEVAPDIGLIPCAYQTELNWTVAEDFADWPPRRLAESHKGTFGHLLILAGSLGYHGAAVLAARAALRARPGLVTVWTPAESYIPIASQLQAAMVHPWNNRLEAPKTTTAVLIGPGLASPEVPARFRTLAKEMWRGSPLPLVVDASALAWLPAGPNPGNALRLITPHPGEAARLLEMPTAQVQANRPQAVRSLSERLAGCWVVLKGHQTLVGSQTGSLYVNSSGNPGLAQGGSGDVLAGYLGGLLAQPSLQEQALRTIRYGVWIHGATADRLHNARAHWTVEDLVDEIGP